MTRFLVRVGSGLPLLCALGGCDAMMAKATSSSTPQAAKVPKARATAPCAPTLVTDQYTTEGINTRTGCLLIDDIMLGEVQGAVDFGLVVKLVLNEGNTPDPALYDGNAWFGMGAWLSTDEYITDEKGTYTLHTPRGDVVYDTPAKVPVPLAARWGAEENIHPRGGDPAIKLFDVLRTKPFDGTFLVTDYDFDGQFPIYYVIDGNPLDARSLVKEFAAPLPRAKPRATTRLLSRLRKRSIVGGPENEIKIVRDYATAIPSVTFESTLFTSVFWQQGAAKAPLRIRGAVPRNDGGYEVRALETLLNGFTSEVVARADGRGNIIQVSSPGRWESRKSTRDPETRRITLEYWSETDPTKTVLAGIKVDAGIVADRRVLSWWKFFGETNQRTGTGSDKKRFAVRRFVDATLAGAEQTHLVSLCPLKTDRTWDADGPYFTFNYADGASFAHEYGTQKISAEMVVRVKETSGKEYRFWYNRPQGGVLGGGYQPATGLELRYLEVQDEGAPTYLPLGFRYDKFTIDTFQVPVVGKISITKSVGDRAVLYRAVFGEYADPYNDLEPGRMYRTFLAPRAVAQADGLTRFEYQSLDGFTWETWDDAGVMTAYRWRGEAPDAKGRFQKEVIETRVLGVPQRTTTRDRFGRVLTIVDEDPNGSVTTTYERKEDGSVAQIMDEGSKTTFVVEERNATGSTVTKGKVLRDGTTIVSYTQPADDFGSPEGDGTMQQGPIAYATRAVRIAAGQLESATVTGPSGLSVKTDVGYLDKAVVPNRRGVNGQTQVSARYLPMMAKGGCK